ncbi:type II toxin-antitoxin system RelE/ParE family toxin [Dactylococcopsis salina]|uniref:type II toxin-antitoxin system RelE/ParE family toxin n=1 Tax=Dactylococcopsis salina TaxID=292566 RepID=UPI00030F48F8
MSRRCRFTRIASSDLENILDYIAEQNGIDVAEKFLKRINQKCQILNSENASIAL